jgi:hypothetical protein
VTRYTQDIDESKEMFLAILGHDLRTPLGASLMASRFMLETGELPEPHATLAARIASSSTRMLEMVGDLLDFTRSRLGGGIPITGPTSTSARWCTTSSTSWPPCTRVARSRSTGAAPSTRRGTRPASARPSPICWATRSSTASGRARRVEIRGTPDDVTIAIHNRGPTIPAALIEGIFRPMKGREARAHAAATGPLGNLGLGLYIADRIVHAHRGRIASSPRPRAGRRSPCTCRGAHERADPDDRTAGAQLAWATAHVEYTGGDADQQRPARRAVGRYRAAQPDSSLHRAGGAQGPLRTFSLAALRRRGFPRPPVPASILP